MIETIREMILLCSYEYGKADQILIINVNVNKRKKNMKKNESGRSMVEMLGVLAIIGVLSIGGIAGYTLAMNRYRANEIMDTAAKLAIVSMSKTNSTEPTVATLGLENPIGGANLSVANGVVTVDGASAEVMSLVGDLAGNKLNANKLDFN